jgi:hypothetical protein
MAMIKLNGVTYLEHELLNKKAIMIPVHGYASELIGMTGTIKLVYGNFFLEFDKKSLKNNRSNLQRGVYLADDSFRLL